MDVEYQAGVEGLRYAASKGLVVVIMEGLRGGTLTGQVPPSVQALWDTASVQRTPAEWALQWLWSQPEVSVVLSGMSTMEQVVENVESASRSGVNTMTAGELAVVDRLACRPVQDRLSSLGQHLDQVPGRANTAKAETCQPRQTRSG